MSPSPSGPGLAIAAHTLAISAKLVPLPSWLGRHPLTLASPAVRQTMWMRGRHLTGNQDLGFLFVQRFRIDDSFLFWKLVGVAPSIRAAHDSYAQWSPLVFEFADVSCVEAGDRVWVRAVPPPGLVLDRCEQDFRVAATVRMWRMQLRRPALAPLQVHFTYARPRSLRAHRTLLGECELSFGQPVLQLSLPRALYDAPLPRADAAEFARLCAAAPEAVGQLMGRSVASQVDASLASLLATHTFSARAVAQQLGLSVRTLRRRLAEEGRSFQQLVDEVRHRELELHAEAGLHSVSRLARLVGFSSDRALRHAMRRWRRPKAIGRL